MQKQLSALQSACQAALQASDEAKPFAIAKLLDAFRGCASESLLRAELQRLFLVDPLAAQYGLRLVRSAYSKAPFGADKELFLAAFCLVLDPSKTSVLEVLPLAADFQAWLSTHLAEPVVGSRCFVASVPETAAEAQSRLSASLRRLALGLALEGEKGLLSVNSSGSSELALVWPIVFKVSPTYGELLAKTLVPGRPTTELLAFKHRIEEQFPGVAFLGAYNWSDACSFSKLAALRLSAKRLQADAYVLKNEVEVILLREGSPVHHVTLTEETPLDVEKALAKVGVYDILPPLNAYALQ